LLKVKNIVVWIVGTRETLGDRPQQLCDRTQQSFKIFNRHQRSLKMDIIYRTRIISGRPATRTERKLYEQA